MSKASMQLEELVRTFAEEDDKFEGGNAAAGTRARKALMEIKRLCDSRRKEIQDAKNAG
ncbi:MAG: histone H1 [Pseudomonadota bacterium]|nr:histone H1 [Pseudomonadota bacterium]MDE3037707.1 histone H1 [Pseudomonadota bacterium]